MYIYYMYIYYVYIYYMYIYYIYLNITNAIQIARKLMPILNDLFFDK